MTHATSEAAGECLAFVMDGRGGGQRLPRAAWQDDDPAARPLWLHLSPDDPDAQRWLGMPGRLPPIGREVMLGPIVQTRVELTADRQLFLALKAAPGAQSRLGTLRVWVTPYQIVTISEERLPAGIALADAFARGEGPRDPVDSLFWLALSSNRRSEQAVLAMDDELAELEYHAPSSPRETFSRLSQVHREAAGLRRGKLRERDALSRIVADGPDWLIGQRTEAWRDLNKRTADIASLLDGIIDRAHGLYEYVSGHLATVLNDRLYVLTLISAIMLPLSFITGLLGVNVAGVPGKDSPGAFIVLCIFLALLAVAQFYVARRLNWIPPRPKGGYPRPVSRPSETEGRASRELGIARPSPT